MINPSGERRRNFVRRMFTRIAPRYDLLNRLMTFGQDQRWRKTMIRDLESSDRARVLDLGAGTGDLAFEVLQQHPAAFVIAADLTPEMIRYGQQRDPYNTVHWVVADADQLPFPNDAFDAVVSGFLLRNLENLELSLSDQRRVLAPDGRWAALDTTPPPDGILKPFIRLYLHVVVPLLGLLVAGDREAYLYLPDSTEHFLRPDALRQRLRQAGFDGVSFQLKMFGTVASYSARKP